MNIELKEKVKQYIDQKEGEFYPDEISHTLNADFQEIMDICKELIEEGIIEIASLKIDTLNKIPKEKIILDSLFRYKDPISFDEAKKLLNMPEKELRKMIDNYEYNPTSEDLSIAYKEESEQAEKLLKEWHSEKLSALEKDLIEKNKRNLFKIKKIMDYIYDLDMLDFITEDEIFYHLFNELDQKYLVDIESNESSSFSDDDEIVKTIKPNIIEWFGEDFGLGFKDKEYYLLSFHMKQNDMKYWYVSKMKVDNLMTAKKVGALFELLEDM